MKRVLRRGLAVIVVAALTAALAPGLLLLVFRFVDPPTTAFMTHARQQFADNGQATTLYQRWVPIENMAACMPLAVVASEDQTFPDHHGFAWNAIEKALAANARGNGMRGASTITQQTSKNLFLWPARSYIRKGIEAYVTVWMTLVWPKSRVLEVYLNVAQFGPRVFGVDQAARRFFDRAPGALTQRQCASLAAVLPAPTEYNAAHPSGHVASRIDLIQGQMRNLGGGYLDSVLKP